jgi:ribosomal-protein-alanine N-acetyltransferase
MARRRSPLPHPRRATDDDLPALAALERACFDDAWSAGSLQDELLHPDSLVLVVDDLGTTAEDSSDDEERRPPVAYASWRRVLDEAELLRLAVLPRARRRGLAGVLLAGGDTVLAAAGCSACFLEVREDNHGAIAFYEEVGFHRLGRRRGYYAGVVDALIYARTLRPDPDLETSVAAPPRDGADAAPRR